MCCDGVIVLKVGTRYSPVGDLDFVYVCAELGNQTYQLVNIQTGQYYVGPPADTLKELANRITSHSKFVEVN